MSQPTRNPLTRGLPCAASIGARVRKLATIALGGARDMGAERSACPLIGQHKSGFAPVRNATIGHHLLRISAALGRHPSEPRNVPNTRRNVPRRKSSTEKKMTKKQRGAISRKRQSQRAKSRQPLRGNRDICRCRGVAVPERGEEPRLCAGCPRTGQMDRRDGGGLIYWRGRRCRLAQTLPFHGWTCPRSARPQPRGGR